MKLPDACFKSPYKEATRTAKITNTKYLATMYKLPNGGFEIRYKRQTDPCRMPVEAQRFEIEGFDDWEPVLPEVKRGKE